LLSVVLPPLIFCLSAAFLGPRVAFGVLLVLLVVWVFLEAAVLSFIESRSWQADRWSRMVTYCDDWESLIESYRRES